MFRAMIAAGVLALTVGCASGASAGVYADDLSKCLVKSANEQDRTVLMQWFFTMLASNPSIKSMSSVTDAQRANVDRKTADLFMRLLTVDCHSEVVTALRNEGGAVMETSFSTLGQVAARGLFSNPAAVQDMQGFTKYLDKAKLDALFKEGGAATDPGAAPAK
jgi:hypothetical protein